MLASVAVWADGRFRPPLRLQRGEGLLEERPKHLREDPREWTEGDRDVRRGHPADPEPVPVPDGGVQSQVCRAFGPRDGHTVEEQR